MKRIHNKNIIGRAVAAAGLISSTVLSTAALMVPSVHAAAAPIPYKKVVFDRGLSSIVMRNLDGTNEKVLFTKTAEMAEVSQPVFDTDNSKVYFEVKANGEPGQSDIYSVNIDGTGSTNLTNTPLMSERFPATNYANGDVLFTSASIYSGNPVIRKAVDDDFAGSTSVREISGAYIYDVNYSEDGQRFVFQEDIEGNKSVWIDSVEPDVDAVKLSIAPLTVNDFSNPRIYRSASHYVVSWSAVTGGSHRAFVSTTTLTVDGAIATNATMNAAQSASVSVDTAGTTTLEMFTNTDNKIAYFVSAPGSDATAGIFTKDGEVINTAALSYGSGLSGTTASNTAGGVDVTVTGDKSGDDFTIYDKDVLIVSEGAKVGEVFINPGGTLRGKGSVGSVYIAPGARIAPGLSPGCITATGNSTISGALDIEIGGGTACTLYDQFNGTAVDITGASLNVTNLNGFTPSLGQVFDIVNGSTSITGTFTGLANGATVTVGSVQYRINYTANKVTLTSLTAGTGTATAPNTGLLTQSLTLQLSSLVAGVMLIGGLVASRRFKKN